MKYIFSILIIVVLIVSCAKEEEKKKFHGDTLFEPSKEKPELKVEGNLLTINELTFRIPAGWTQEFPDNEMRLVQFNLASDASLKVIGFYFGNHPEMVKENIERWKAEFTALDNSKDFKVAGNKITMVTLDGTYKKKPFPMAEESVDVPGWMMIASIVPSENGPFYFKLVGPKSLIDPELPRFKAFMESFKTK